MQVPSKSFNLEKQIWRNERIKVHESNGIKSRGLKWLGLRSTIFLFSSGLSIEPCGCHLLSKPKHNLGFLRRMSKDRWSKEYSIEWQVPPEVQNLAACGIKVSERRRKRQI